MATLIIGIGNAFRGDDAVGLRVAEALGVSESVRQHDGEPASLIALWEGWDDVVLIDAVTWGRPPGTIVEMDAADSQIPAGVCHSTHALGPAEAIELARALGRLPIRIRLVGIEAADWSFGTPLTAPVQAAAGEVVRRLREVVGGADETEQSAAAAG